MITSESPTIYRVDTAPRLAQWRIDNIACTYRKSERFKMGNWNWHLSIEKNRVLYLKLYPDFSNNKDKPPIASFIIRVISTAADRKIITHPEVTDKQIKNSDDFVWAIDAPLTGRFIIDVEFIDLKITPGNGGEPLSIWGEDIVLKQSNATALSCLNKMLNESIHADITINASNGSIRAHKAILSSRSPVFCSMFGHDLKENALSVVEIPDMSIEACKAFIHYIYGTIQIQEFQAHRLALLRAADKYSLLDLKDACHESLMEDIDTTNVLERLQSASLYGLQELKINCIHFLVKFGKIYDIRDDFDSFLQFADRDLIGEILNEVLNAWKGY